MSEDNIIAELSQELGSSHGLRHMDPNAVAIALWKWLEATPLTPHNSVIWKEVEFLMTEGDFEPDLHERRYAALAGVRALQRGSDQQVTSNSEHGARVQH